MSPIGHGEILNRNLDQAAYMGLKSSVTSENASKCKYFCPEHDGRTGMLAIEDDNVTGNHAGLEGISWMSIPQSIRQAHATSAGEAPHPHQPLRFVEPRHSRKLLHQRSN